jgi:hypothetical protein
MLNEDGLLLVLVLGACTLVVLGTLELVWPTRPRHPRRRPTAVRDVSRRSASRVVSSRQVARPGRVAPPTPAAPPVVPSSMAPSPAVPPPGTDATLSRAATWAAAPTPAAAVPLSDAAASSVTQEVDARIEAPSAPPAPVPVASAPSVLAAAADVPSAVDAERAEFELPAVERAFAMLKEQRLGEVITLAERQLKAMKSGGASATSAQDAAQLWGLTGVAKQGLDDFEGARFAFEEAIAVASGHQRPTWEGHLVALTLSVGRRAVAATGTSPADRVASLTSAVEWLERGLAISPNDPELRDVVTVAREALWAAHEAVVNDLLQRREIAGARRALEDVIADPECPPDRRLAFCRLLDGVNADAQNRP